MGKILVTWLYTIFCKFYTSMKEFSNFFEKVNMKEFSDFIENMRLIEQQLEDVTYTWFK